MKFNFKFISVLLLLVNSVYSQNSSKLDSIPSFRGYEWGETLENIKSSELSRYMQTTIGFGQEIVSYFGKISGFDARVDYVFKNKKLIEGLYEIEVDSFYVVYEKIKEFFIKKLDYPIYWAGSHPNTKVNWEGDSEGLCRGPEIYWEYFDGFIAIIAEKYKEEITISILYVYDKTIVDYGKYVTFPYKVISKNNEE